MKHLIPKLQQLLDNAVANGSECGLQLAIYDHGEPVADLVAGYADAAHTRPITPDSLFPVFSVGKGILTTAAHRLVRRGTLSYSTRIADLWPDFASHGKQNTLFWHFLSHRAGLQNTPWPDTPQELADWDTMCRRVADLTPAWTPGTKHAYHGITFAWLVGNTLALADGRTLPQILFDEVIRPLGLQNELFFGTSDEADTRFTGIDDSVLPAGDLGTRMLNPVIRHACIPSFNGVMSARAIARHYAALLDPVDGVLLLDPDTLANAAIMRRAPDDLPAPDAWAKHGLGYVCQGFPGELGRLTGHGGALGAEGFIDRKRHLAVGFTRNKTSNLIPNLPLRDAISQVLGLPLRHW